MLALVALACAGFLSTLVMRMTDPVVPLLSHDFGVPAADLALLVTAYAIPYAICQLGFGALGDHYGRVKVVRIAVSLLAVFIACTAMVPDYNTMVLVRILSGGVGGGIIPLGIASIGDQVPIENRQVAISRFMTAVILGQMTGALFTGIAAEYVPWRAIYWAYAGIAACVAAGLFCLPAQPESGSREGSFFDAFRHYGRILVRRRAQTLLSMAAVEGLLLVGLVGFLPIYLASARHFSSGQIGLVVGSYGIGGLVFSALAKPAIRLLGGYGLLRLGGIMSGVAAAFALAVPFWLYACMSAMIGFAFFCMHSNLQMRATEMAPEARGSAVAVFASALFLGSGAGPWTFSHMVPPFGFIGTFAIVGACLIAFGFVTAGVLRHQERVM